MRLLSIGEAAAELGVAVGALRRWHRQGLLMPFGRTADGHRRYQRDTVRATRGGKPRRSATGTAGDGGNTVPLSSDHRYPCDSNPLVQVCAPLS
ncbi:helix-turn-helix domain-containing protein [Paraburkholderia sp. RL17-347-BIC-D]|uniref:helix-turn-helix domain-containing protein n=1 Tax=Paraburkholderia sp. RL17-347-BIC-D TaxID=3031632 RepID=UPI0038BB0AD6